MPAWIRDWLAAGAQVAAIAEHARIQTVTRFMAFPVLRDHCAHILTGNPQEMRRRRGDRWLMLGPSRHNPERRSARCGYPSNCAHSRRSLYFVETRGCASLLRPRRAIISKAANGEAMLTKTQGATLTKTQVEQYRELGYLVVPDVLDTGLMAEIRRTVEAIVADAGKVRTHTD